MIFRNNFLLVLTITYLFNFVQINNYFDIKIVHYPQFIVLINTVMTMYYNVKNKMQYDILRILQ